MATKDALIAEEGHHANGDAAVFDVNAEKVNFELEPKAIGLTKEQLEKYRNDPFWKPVRTILFALFWLAWVAMFGGAIAIVLLSPKCAEKQKPDWWQTKVSYQLLTATFRDSDGDGVGDFNGITEKIDLLRKIGVTTIYPTPVMQVSKGEYFNPYDVTDHLAVDPKFGTEEDFKNLIETAHNRDMYVVVDMPLTSVSTEHPWFVDKKESMFKIARPSMPSFNSTNFYPFHGSNMLKYYGYPTSENPVLNWDNENVRSALEGSIKKFLLLGVDGFHLDHVSQLALDGQGKQDHDAAIKRLGELTKAVNDIISANEKLVDKKIVLFSSLKDIEELGVQARQTGQLHTVIDNTFTSISQKKCTPNVAKCVHDLLSVAHTRHEENSYTPYWQFSNADSSRLASRFDQPTAHLLTFLQLTLPGSLSVYYGQELGLIDGVNRAGIDQHRNIMQWTPKDTNHHGFTNDNHELFFAETADNLQQDNFDTQFGLETSPLKTYRKLAMLRQRDEALIVGETIRDELVGEVIAFSRYVRGENNTAHGSAFVVALNFGNVDYEVDLQTSQMQKLIPSNKGISNVEVSVVTTNITAYAARQKLNLAESKFVLPPKQAVLLKL